MIHLMCEVIVIVFVVTCNWTSGNWSDKDPICHLLSYIFLRLSSISDFPSQFSYPPSRISQPLSFIPILHTPFSIPHPLTQIPQPPSCISHPASPTPSQPTFPSPIAHLHLPPPSSDSHLPFPNSYPIYFTVTQCDLRLSDKYHDLT